MDNFTLKFEYKEHPHILEVKPWQQQYKTVYRVTIQEHEIIFEPDEEGFPRAVADNHAHAWDIDAGLLADVARRIAAHINGEEAE
ncbi:MAG TPA: hypothetical protein VFS25_22285 [Chitinophaga sp.]|uniref:hypothetical protein n=1 Tax=Chitinophaga sp. TaxID=1869181 RepID=UPI002DBFC43E|nr:hypothetical protein [Chitinophaga sp.]HEU4555591.1 hypothetical protein [Chitinophaga sp.]